MILHGVFLLTRNWKWSFKFTFKVVYLRLFYFSIWLNLTPHWPGHSINCKLLRLNCGAGHGMVLVWVNEKGTPPTVSNNNGIPSMAKEILYWLNTPYLILHCEMFLSLCYILIVKYTTLIFQFWSISEPVMYIWLLPTISYAINTNQQFA